MQPDVEWISQQIRAAGPVIDLRRLVSLYAPLHEVEPYRGVTVSRDLRYGPHDRNLADIFRTDDQGAPRPILLFVHGGGYIVGDRRVRPGSPFYDNVALWGARYGFLAINMTYRLAPADPWPAAQQDIAAAIAWVRAAAFEWGGDPDAIVLMGHSAGATHIACYVAHPEYWADGIGICGAILVSPTGGATPDDRALADDLPFLDHERAYFGSDDALYATRAAVPALAASEVPLLFVGPEFDPAFFQRHLDRLRDLFTAAGREDRFIVLDANNHMSTIFSLNTADIRLGDLVAGFVDDVCGIASPRRRIGQTV
ncbi:alpha/beta hydrolase [Sphingomonas bacterium]|uniref:alpha/beta hydrolase n=1 Tax=Sphingomonas bacterium TaxID=1895847 RepID=UPI001575C970|nr:alpha/beta hydrolase [Sphingomonas bacterium]